MTSAERLDRLEAENRELRDDLAALRASLATEVRTRRLVVEEEDGFERIVAEGRGATGDVRVYARSTDSEGPTCVHLVGNDEGTTPRAAVCLMAEGHIFGTFAATGDIGDGGRGCRLDVHDIDLTDRVVRLGFDLGQLRRVLLSFGVAAGALLGDEALLRLTEPQEVSA